MTGFLSNLLIAVITAAVPVLTAYGVALIRKTAADVAAGTEDANAQRYITEISIAVSDAVAATSQTYVDALKNKGEFTLEAQREAAKKALASCIASLTPAARDFITEVYGDINGYLTNKIEAEVRSQKLGFAALVS